MKQFLTDPVVLTCGGIILVGIFGLFWAIGKFRRIESPAVTSSDTLGDFASVTPNLGTIDFRAQSPTFASPAVSSPTVSKDVAARLDSMTQRLTEMQTVLMKQSSGAVVEIGRAHV